MTFELNSLAFPDKLYFENVFIYKLEPGYKSSGFSLVFLFSIFSQFCGNQFVARTGSFGYYQFLNVPSGSTYIGQVQSKRYAFESRAVTVDDQVTDLDFVAFQ